MSSIVPYARSFLVAGGKAKDDSKPRKDVYIYNLEADSWEALATKLTLGASGMAAFTADKKLSLSKQQSVNSGNKR